MKRFLALAALAVLLGSLAYMLFATPHIPLLDANRTLLAETYEQGYCAGITFGETRGYGDAAKAAECRDSLDADDTINLDVVQEAFCAGFQKSYGFPADQCMMIMTMNEMWPTLDGSVTSSWNRAFPYPGRTFDNTPTDSRGNERDNNERTGETLP